MARIRTVKPEFFTHSGLGELLPWHRLLFIGLWTQADRAGRLKDDAKKLKVVLLPYDEVDIDKLLQELQDCPESFITRYEVKGEKYIQINNFLDHQHPHIKEPESTIPAPCKPGARTRRAPVEPVGREGKGREGKGREGGIVEQVVSHLNTVLETDYKPESKKTRELIKARQTQGFTLENFKTVIDKKAAQWKTDPKMCAYLRPETLFGTKFESYLNERAGPPPKSSLDKTVDVLRKFVEEKENEQAAAKVIDALPAGFR